MPAFFHALQDSAFSAWVVGSDSIWAYPMILTMHTIGLGIVVGAAVVIDFRLLGVGPGIPLEEVRRVFPIFWVGFIINLVSGLMLFVSEAADKATQPVFLVKLLLVASASSSRRASAAVFWRRVEPEAQLLSRARPLAIMSIVGAGRRDRPGRLMAYLK